METVGFLKMMRVYNNRVDFSKFSHHNKYSKQTYANRSSRTLYARQAYDDVDTSFCWWLFWFEWRWTDKRRRLVVYFLLSPREAQHSLHVSRLLRKTNTAYRGRDFQIIFAGSRPWISRHSHEKSRTLRHSNLSFFFPFEYVSAVSELHPLEVRRARDCTTLMKVTPENNSELTTSCRLRF